MNKLDKLLEKNNKGVNKAVRTLYDIQCKNIKSLSTKYEFLNNLCFGGLLPDSVITFLARPSHGKTYFANSIRRDILSDKSRNIGLLYYNWEMSWFNLLLIEAKKKLQKSYKDILNNEPTEEELSVMKEIADEFRDTRFHSIDRSLTPEEFDYVTRKYIEQNLDKDQIFIFIDHIGITKGDNKFQAIYGIMEVCNGIKLDYPQKLTFIILGQLNREIEKLWRSDTKSINLAPTSEYIYGSDAIQQFSDLIIAMVIPQRMNMEEYVALNIERNPHLREHVIPKYEAKPGDIKVLKGLNRIYYHVLKHRLQDDLPSTYCEILSKDAEDKIEVYKQFEKEVVVDDEEDEFEF